MCVCEGGEREREGKREASLNVLNFGGNLFLFSSTDYIVVHSRVEPVEMTTAQPRGVQPARRVNGQLVCLCTGINGMQQGCHREAAAISPIWGE